MPWAIPTKKMAQEPMVNKTKDIYLFTSENNQLFMTEFISFSEI